MATEHLLHNGNYYGYPLCCIKAFIEQFPNKFANCTEIQQKAARNGFVPCVKHAEQIVEGKLKVEELILPTRKHPRPFKK